MAEELNLNCALVTGASRGIGRAIALQLAIDHRLHILINYHSNERAAKETLTAIEQSGGSGELLPFPVQDKAIVEDTIDRWQAQNSDKIISVLVNNAGISKDGWFMWMAEEDWDSVMDVSLKGMYNVTQPILRAMLKNKYGRIINISSLSGLKGTAGQVNYSAAKAGMIGATKALAQEVAKMKITVNAVAPGYIDTEMIQETDTETYLKLIPMNRTGKPEEVAHLVSFLASDKASYISGEVININGGLYS